MAFSKESKRYRNLLRDLPRLKRLRNEGYSIKELAEEYGETYTLMYFFCVEEDVSLYHVEGLPTVSGTGLKDYHMKADTKLNVVFKNRFTHVLVPITEYQELVGSVSDRIRTRTLTDLAK